MCSFDFFASQTDARRRKRMHGESPMNVQVDLLQPVPVLRGSVVGVNVTSSSSSGSGYYIVTSSQESNGLCYFDSSDHYISSTCPTTSLRHGLTLLIQPLVGMRLYKQ